MKKRFCLVLSLLMILPACVLAEGSVLALVDWTEVVVALIGMLSALMYAAITLVWTKYIKPWLDMRELKDAAVIVVDAVEALLGRYAGADKWQLALEKMQERGFNADSEVVMDALRSAWKQLDMKQIMAGEKVPQGVPPDDGE